MTIFIDMEWSENLSVTTFRNGDIIQQITDATQWLIAAEEGVPAWCYYNNDPSLNDTYGKLYNWYAVNDPRNIAPIGYHLPTDIEMDTASPIDFTYLAGSRQNDGTFDWGGIWGYYWTTTENNWSVVWYRRFTGDELIRDYNFKSMGFSIKCIKD